MNQEARGDTNCGGCGGCVATVLAVVVLWAFLFGVTYAGKHYSLSLSCSEGVVVQ